MGPGQHGNEKADSISAPWNHEISNVLAFYLMELIDSLIFFFVVST